MGRFGELREPAPAISRIGNLERVSRFHKGQRDHLGFGVVR